jgi:hypothetical protein
MYTLIKSIMLGSIFYNWSRFIGQTMYHYNNNITINIKMDGEQMEYALHQSHCGG